LEAVISCFSDYFVAAAAAVLAAAAKFNTPLQCTHWSIKRTREET